HTRYHLYRAIIEGLGFELYQSLKIMERRAKLTVDEIFVGGGGARSDVVCQILADIMGLPVKRIQTHEACSIGASMVAFVADGVFKDYDDAIRSMVHEKDVFTPDETAHSTYMDIYKGAYSKIFGKLEPIYRKIIKITKRRNVQ
ncbi:MAG: FGGY-family carbohydrate kinase, partial [Oscillospiraceae bacterium]|nr:FGGY-family carbohydrate kinase [Oscillospiraceae bacterium]